MIPQAGKSLSRPHRAGFTLIELMVVVIILAMVAGVSAISWQALVPNQALNTQVRNLSEVLYGTRSEAIARNRVFKIFYDLDQERYWVQTPYRLEGEGFATAEDEPRILTNETNLASEGITIESITYDDETYTDGIVYIRFDPLGASSYHTIVVYQAQFERHFTLEVLPLTGDIRFHDGFFQREPVEERDFP